MRTCKSILSFGGLLCALLLTAAAVQARSQSGYLGNPSIGTDSTCFQSQLQGGVTNNCTSARFWFMPLTFDLPGTKTVRVNAGTTGTGKLTCSLLMTTGAGGATAMPFPAFGGGVVSQQVVVTVAAGTVATVTCSLGATGSATVYTIDYTQ
jgi:hypothetical protein